MKKGFEVELLLMDQLSPGRNPWGGRDTFTPTTACKRRRPHDSGAHQRERVLADATIDLRRTAAGN